MIPFILSLAVTQVTYLDVTEPPDIIDERTPGELRVRENEPLKLTCEARGNPPPRITWKREDGHDLHLSPRDDPKGEDSLFYGSVWGRLGLFHAE